MEKIARFEKVSFEQFKKDWLDTFPNDDYIDREIKDVYDNIKLPTRATNGSAGYDFKSPIGIVLKRGETIKIPTGIRVNIEDGWVLMCYPRSGLGFKYRLQLDNTTGVIDSDYFKSNNEGHIFAKITNDSKIEKTVVINVSEGFMQGIFTPFGITYDDDQDSKKVRNGGFGSTT